MNGEIIRPGEENLWQLTRSLQASLYIIHTVYKYIFIDTYIQCFICKISSVAVPLFFEAWHSRQSYDNYASESAGLWLVPVPWSHAYPHQKETTIPPWQIDNHNGNNIVDQNEWIRLFFCRFFVVLMGSIVIENWKWCVCWQSHVQCVG